MDLSKNELLFSNLFPKNAKIDFCTSRKVESTEQKVESTETSFLANA